MKKLSICYLILFSALWSQHYQVDFPPEEFKTRWEGVFEQIGDKAVAVVQGFPLSNGFIMPRQTNAFYYLSGIETPHAYILLDGRDKKVTLYMPPRNERLERSEGRILNADDEKLIKKLVGVDAVYSVDVMRENFPPDLDIGTVIYTMFTPAEGQGQSRYELEVANASIAADPWDGRISRESRLVQLLRMRNRRNEVKDLTPIIDKLRSVKSPNEIALIRRASQLAGLGMIEAIKSTEPGVWEYQLDGVARYVFLINGSRLEAYRSITASGTENLSNGHYYRNDSQLKSGDMVLMDYAPDFRYYVSDIGRMWPVNGIYEPWQRELLQIILEYRNVVLEIIRPGITNEQVLEEARQKMKPIMKRYKFSKKIYKKAAEKMVQTGGGVLSHPVGLAVHDDGPYRYGPLKVGHVFSVDPQMWVPEENLYLRYEDTIVVTENGNENFTHFLPSELDELEKLVREKGMLQSFPKDSMQWKN
ncbi:MAG: aminopeptidase P N-terminal domain-containing protein [Candidatus Neomarinimicrobiota bacterium]|nr:aminopeptidase P N-terminal domain-containing protein [Candidatus Neomarinimicrobiota bacterium]